MKKKYAILFLFLCITEITVFGQKIYDFEDTSKWESKNNSQFSITNDKSLNGSKSLKYHNSKTFMNNGLISIEVGETISKVRTANFGTESAIIASSYEGIIMAVGFDGAVRWKNKLSGFMNHDIWCEDITGDGIDEILAANANGTIYCLDYNGKLKWEFKQNDAPMYSVCVVTKNNIPYVVCGGFDKNVYYINADGSLKQTLDASTYSVNKVFNGFTAPSNTHIANFLRKIKNTDGSETLVVLGTNNSMQVTGNIYLFDVLGTTPKTASVKIESGKPIGDLKIADINGDGTQEILVGTSAHVNDASVVTLNTLNLTETQGLIDIASIRNKVGAPGYRVTQPEVIPNGSSIQYFILHGPNILLVGQDLDINNAEILKGPASFNDMWRDPATNKIILASNQSGGSEIFIIDTSISTWKTAFVNFSESGKIKEVTENITNIENALANFTKPTWERNPLNIYVLHDNNTTVDPSIYNAPIFIPQPFMPNVQSAESWNRASMTNEKYREKRDGRRNYILDENEAFNLITSNYSNNGISYWGGHGNDPYFYSLTTTKRVIDFAAGRKTVLIYPEMEDHSADFQFVMDDLINPLAAYGKDKNLNLFIRSKNIFWQGSAYLSEWTDLLSGKYADVFVPSMEETTDKTMELSLAGRMGLWASGAVNSWGSRAVPDNTSYDRLRQHSDQQLSNHFLRQLIYVAASGAQYFDNFTKPTLFANLIAKGALFIPKREEIVSFSPVHLSMITPNSHYLEEGAEVKWLTNFDATFEDNNPFVFSKMNGSWPGAPLNDWDFSKYAANGKERRLNFLPNYKNGMVLITPPQKGFAANTTAIRGKMVDKLHPLYKNILKEYYTDGKSYYSESGAEFSAKTYYNTIKTDLETSAKKIPLTVSGDDVAWVVAQTSPKHLRLTLIDGGYINPKNRKAIVTFNTVTPIKMSDIVDGKQFTFSNLNAVEIDIPAGAFRFIDIELTAPLID